MQQLAERLAKLGQLPLYPPNVKGWDGGKSWINASTVLARANLVAEIANSPETTYRDGSLTGWAKANPAVTSMSGPNWADEYLFAATLPEAADGQLVAARVNEMRSTVSWLAALPEFQLN